MWNSVLIKTDFLSYDDSKTNSQESSQEVSAVVVSFPFRIMIIKGHNNMAKVQSLQDPFLNALRKDRIAVSIYLVNGIKLQGQVESFDQFVILLKNQVSQMVYKHAISTIVPARAVTISQPEDKDEEAPAAEE